MPVFLLLGLLISVQQSDNFRLTLESPILQEGEPLMARISHLRPGTRAWLEIQRHPVSLVSPKTKPEVLLRRLSEGADQLGQIRVNFDLDSQISSDLPGQLWLHAIPLGSDFGRRALFGITVDRCTLFNNLVHTFFEGPCDLQPLQVFQQFRDSQEWRTSQGELLLVSYPPSHPPVVIPKSRGATGHFWTNRHQLLFTRRFPRESGLYRYDLNTKKTVQLARTTKARAPFSLPNGTLGWVDETTYPARLITTGKSTTWKLPVAFDQILAVSNQADSLLAMHLDSEFQQPILFTISLETGEIQEWGPLPNLYLRTMQQPNAKNLLIMNATGSSMATSLRSHSGDIIWFSSNDQTDSHVFPSWSPDGHHFALLRHRPE